MKFRIVGADRQTGADVSKIIEAPGLAAAEAMAAKQGIMVERVVRVAKTIDPPDGFWESFGDLFCYGPAVLMIGVGLLAAIGGDPLEGVRGWLAVIAGLLILIFHRLRERPGGK